MNLLIFLCVVFVLVLAFIARGITSVRQGYVVIVERFGKYFKTLQPGLRWIMPIIQKPKTIRVLDKEATYDYNSRNERDESYVPIYKYTHEINMKEQLLDIPSQEVITKDNAMVRVDGVVFFEIQDPYAAVYQVDDLNTSLENLVMTNIRTVMGSMEVDELLSQRDVINQKLLSVVDKATDVWGTKITRVEIKNIEPPEDLVKAMAQQMVAEREKRASILKAEGEKQSAILKAEGEKQAAVLSAEGEKEVAFRQAEARERAAEAEAKATTSISDAIKKGDVQSLNYFLGQSYVEALKEIVKSPNEKLLMLPFETQQLASSLTGIAALTKDVFNKSKKQ